MKTKTGAGRAVPEKIAADIAKVDRRTAALQQELNSLQLIRETLALRAALDLRLTSAEFDSSALVLEGDSLTFKRVARRAARK